MQGMTMPDGKFKRGVFVFRTVEDCRGIAAYAEGEATAAVIGGGLLGLEAARRLQNFGWKSRW
jgi:nitrite reductase (NADH) large subunit